MREDQFRQIHEASLRVLGTTGVVFDSGDICQRFRASGFATEGRCVFMREDQVAAAIHAAPRSFELVARDNVLTAAADRVTDLLQTYERPPLDDLTRRQLEDYCTA